MASNPEKLKIVKEIGRKEILFCVARAAGEDHLFAGGSDGNVYAVNFLDEKPDPQALVGHSSYVTGIATADRFVVSGSYDRRLIWWDRDTRESVRTVDGAHERWIRGVVASPDGKLIASVADDMVCRVWKSDDSALVHELRGHDAITPHHFPSMLYCCAFSPDGSRLATADKTGRIVVWNVESGEQLTTLEAPTMYTWDPKQRIHSIGGIRSLAFSPDGRLLAVGGMGQVGNIDHLGAPARLEVFDWEKQERTHECPGDEYKGLIEHLEFHPQGEWLVAAGGDNGGFIKFFDLNSGKLIKQDKAPMHVHDFKLNDACDTIFAVGHGRMIVWSIEG